MEKMVEKILNQYGASLTLCQGQEETQVRAFFQPVLSKSWQYLEGNYSPLGEIPRGQYVYIGPVSPAAAVGDTVRVGEQAYLFRRTELVNAGDRPAYCWGICVEKGGADTWGTQS